MYLVKLVLLACPVLVASILLVVNPANATSMKSAPTTEAIALVSAQPVLPEMPHLTQASNPITDQLACNCANCVQTKLNLLQGKLPSGNF
ncbi:hypothetical protein [Nostoc sp. TCL26-01]|uniref:hypothetical protein n=1 Tax=Nostoc sp. TCL26-01 TaxID=2576904 RepID=UPI0015BD3389|nr:hypothetical protein [Nostoc sp. TCL26-01]QLE56528.1 hypothetical protein FD725_13985 [Nostoc sp. TCL26-01]